MEMAPKRPNFQFSRNVKNYQTNFRGEAAGNSLKWGIVIAMKQESIKKIKSIFCKLGKIKND